MIFRSKLVLLLALTLIVGVTQCVASCTFEACDAAKAASEQQKLPPCHRHHQQQDSSKQSSPCSHQVVVADAVVVSNIFVVEPPVAAQSANLQIVLALRPSHRTLSFDAHPPGDPSPSILVLRI